MILQRFEPRNHWRLVKTKGRILRETRASDLDDDCTEDNFKPFKRNEFGFFRPVTGTESHVFHYSISLYMQGVRAFQAHRLNFLCRIRQKDRQDHCISIYGSPVGMYLVGSRGMNP